MNLTSDLDDRIDKAREWLVGAQLDGGYRRWLVGRNKWGPISSEITGYAAHLFAWMFATYGRDVDRRSALAAGDWLQAEFKKKGVIAVEPDSDKLYFFDMGICARGLFAISKSLALPEFWDLAIAVGCHMRRFQRPSFAERGCYDAILHTDFTQNGIDPDWWSRKPGPYQRKAALVWKLLKVMDEYDELDVRWIQEPYPNPAPATPKKKLAPEDATALLDMQCRAADELHPMAYSCEALAVGEASRGRSEFATQRLAELVEGSEVVRCDVLAQLIRLQLVHGWSLPVKLLHELFDFQHDSGGFAFRNCRGVISRDLSVHATIFAMQAMSMCQDMNRSRLPGILGRRELAIV